MIYVFEDKASDLLSLLYQAAYPPDVAGKFIYAEGSTKLPFRVGELAMQFPEEKIVVFMDIVPDNNHLLVIYNKLRKMAIAGTQVLVIPCICSEYYFIEAYHSTSVFKCGEGVDIALEVRPWKQSQLLYTPADLQFCKNFERYCKLILRKCVRQCATHSRLYKGRENPLYGLFYTRDCPCGEDKCGMWGAGLNIKSFAVCKPISLCAVR